MWLGIAYNFYTFGLNRGIYYVRFCSLLIFIQLIVKYIVENVMRKIVVVIFGFFNIVSIKRNKATPGIYINNI